MFSSKQVEDNLYPHKSQHTEFINFSDIHKKIKMRIVQEAGIAHRQEAGIAHLVRHSVLLFSAVQNREHKDKYTGKSSLQE